LALFIASKEATPQRHSLNPLEPMIWYSHEPQTGHFCILTIRNSVEVNHYVDCIGMGRPLKTKQKFVK